MEKYLETYLLEISHLICAQLRFDHVSRLPLIDILLLIHFSVVFIGYGLFIKPVRSCCHFTLQQLLFTSI